MRDFRKYAVKVRGFDEAPIYNARTPAKARAAAFRDFNNVYECTFRRFLEISTVRRARCREWE